MIQRIFAASLALCLFFTQPTLAAQPLLTVNKTPFESFNCGVDFTQVIGADGTTVISVTSINLANSQDSTATIIATSPAPFVQGSTDIVSFRVQNGTIGDRHLISVRVSDTATGEKFEGQLSLKIASGS